MKKLECLFSVGVLVGIIFLLLPTFSILNADQAQFFYDELGRLVGVVDGNGDVAVYNYDAVGNLLSIEQFTQGGSGIGVFVLAPGSALAGTDIEIGGFGFSATPAPVVSAEPGKKGARVFKRARSRSTGSEGAGEGVKRLPTPFSLSQ